MILIQAPKCSHDFEIQQLTERLRFVLKRKNSKKGNMYRVESVVLSQRWGLVAMNQEQEISLSRTASYRQVVMLFPQCSLAHFFSPVSLPRVKYWIGKPGSQQASFSLCKYSRAGRSGLKPSPNAFPGRVTSPRDVMTERSVAKALKPIEVIEQCYKMIL